MVVRVHVHVCLCLCLCVWGVRDAFRCEFFQAEDKVRISRISFSSVVMDSVRNGVSSFGIGGYGFSFLYFQGRMLAGGC
jgi:hypothetical protein